MTSRPWAEVLKDAAGESEIARQGLEAELAILRSIDTIDELPESPAWFREAGNGQLVSHPAEHVTVRWQIDPSKPRTQVDAIELIDLTVEHGREGHDT